MILFLFLNKKQYFFLFLKKVFIFTSRAPDVPDLPCRSQIRSGGGGGTNRGNKEHRAQIVWLESSFVSAIPETKSKL